MDKKNGGKAIVAVVLGIMGLIAWFIPIIGLPLTLVGIIMGLLGLKSYRRKAAITGTILSSVGFLASLVNAILGALIGI